MLEYYNVYTKQLNISYKTESSNVDFYFNVPTLTTVPQLKNPNLVLGKRKDLWGRKENV